MRNTNSRQLPKPAGVNMNTEVLAENFGPLLLRHSVQIIREEYGYEPWVPLRERRRFKRKHGDDIKAEAIFGLLEIGLPVSWLEFWEYLFYEDSRLATEVEPPAPWEIEVRTEGDGLTDGVAEFTIRVDRRFYSSGLLRLLAGEADSYYERRMKKEGEWSFVGRHAFQLGRATVFSLSHLGLRSWTQRFASRRQMRQGDTK